MKRPTESTVRGGWGELDETWGERYGTENDGRKF